MSITRDYFLSKYGERWFLRDFDFLPERLSDRIERQHDISYSFLNTLLSEDGSTKVFKTEKEALMACLETREKLGLKNSDSLKAKAFDILYQDLIQYDIRIKTFLLDNLMDYAK